jgi:hypothetical protein
MKKPTLQDQREEIQFTGVLRCEDLGLRLHRVSVNVASLHSDLFTGFRAAFADGVMTPEEAALILASHKDGAKTIRCALAEDLGGVIDLRDRFLALNMIGCEEANQRDDKPCKCGGIRAAGQRICAACKSVQNRKRYVKPDPLSAAADRAAGQARESEAA